MSEHNNPEMIGVNEIMKKMGIGRDHAYEIIKSNQFHTKKVGRDRKSVV